MLEENKEPEPTRLLIDDVKDQLEKIRDANSDLRSWGQQWHDDYDDLQDELTEITKERDDLQNEIDGLIQKIADLEKPKVEAEVGGDRA